MEDKRICLVRITSSEGQRSHLIEKPTFFVGRAQEADLPYLTPSVSRLHLSVDVKADTIWVTDEKSANGTLLNGNVLEKGKSYRVDANDVIKLGNAPEEFQFLSISKPFELMSVETQKGQFLGSMEEIVKQVERKVEAQYKDKLEKQVRIAQLEAEEVLSDARKEAEVLRTAGLLELQNRKQELEADVLRLEQEAKITSARERLTARKEADIMVSDAQKRIQKDYDESNEQMEMRLRDMQSKCSAMFEQAQSKAEITLSEAQAEASRLRREASEEARTIQQDARRKRDEAFANLQTDFQRELSTKKEEAIASARREGEAERQQLMSNFMRDHESLCGEIASFEKRKTGLESEVTQLSAQQSKWSTELKEIQLQAADAQKLMTDVVELEQRREKAEREFQQYVSQRQDGVGKLENELKQLREQRVVETENAKKDKENLFAKDRLKAIEEIKREIEKREEDYRKTKRLRALELSQKLQERIVPRFPSWSSNPDLGMLEFKAAVEQAVLDIMLTGESSIQASVTNMDSATVSANNEKRTQKVFKFMGIALAIAVVVCLIYRQQLLAYIQSNEKDSVASHIIEERHQASIYKPEQTPEFRDSYTDNVLYMRSYYDVKTNPDYMEKWTLHLNDLHYLNSIGLNEENVVQFVAKETNLVQQLGVLRTSIDAVYLNEGLERMRNAETDAMKEIYVILRGEAKYKEIRKAEKDFFAEWIKLHPQANTTVQSSSAPGTAASSGK